MSSDQYLGEIRLFAGTYAPAQWLFCDGSLLTIRSHESLFALIGTTYGGDGKNTFSVPDFRGRVPIGRGTGIDLSPRQLGETGGDEHIRLRVEHMPPHSHQFFGTTDTATTNNPGNAKPAVITEGGPIRGGYSIDAGGPLRQLNTDVISETFGGEAHSNMMPSRAMNFIIALEGIYPIQY